MEARKEGLRNEAIVYLREAIACHLDFKPAYDALGFILNVLGLQDEAVAVWRQWLEREPGNPVALHMLASVTGEQIPARASDGFVKTTFDGFAASFDEKLKRLDYRAPDFILESVSLELGPSQGRLSILDAGCGYWLVWTWFAAIQPQTHRSGFIKSHVGKGPGPWRL